MTSRTLSIALALCSSWAAACGSDPVDPGADGGVADAAAIPPDGGVRALCPALESPQCTNAAACGTAVPGPNDCAGCRQHYAAACTFGACTTPDTPVTVVNVYSDITQVRGVIRSFVITGLAAETAGGLPITCADVLAGTVTVDEPCATVLDSRTYDLGELRPTGEVYPVILSRFPTSANAVILVQAFGAARGNGALVGHTCVELAAGTQATNDRIDLDGRAIRRL